MDTELYYDWQGNKITQEQWVRLFSDQRSIARDKIGNDDVSTVYLGLNHNFYGNGPPLIFETMIFGGMYTDEMWRWSTDVQARKGHEAIVECLRAGGNPTQLEFETNAA